MDSILSFFSTWVENEQMLTLLIVVLAAGTVFALGLGISYVFLGATDPIRRRIGFTKAEDADEGDHDNRIKVVVETVVGPVSQWLIPKSDLELNETTKKLTYAGFRSPNALQIFYGLKGILMVTFPAVVLFSMQWFPDVTTNKILVYLVIALGVGIFLPNVVLDKLMESRIRQLRNGFPDALDMLVVCVEAGLGLAAAIQRVADEIGVSHHELAMEMSLVNAEIRAGVDRSRALRNLADRTGLDDIRGLVSMLIQAMRFGTSIADTLRVYSEEFRDRRMQKAEEAAAKISTKLIFPLVFCLFPSFFTVAIGPAVIRFIEVFSYL